MKGVPLDHWTRLRDQDVTDRARVRTFRPLTKNQERYVRAVETHTVTLVDSPPGTGKTYVACAVAARMLREGKVDRIILARPLVQCDEELGILPGTLEEKMAPYIAPLVDALGEFFTKGELLRLQVEEKVTVCPLAVMRGRSFKRAFLVLDEASSATMSQLRMFLTRFGEGCKVVVCGDVYQTDLKNQVTTPFDRLLDLLDGHPDIAVVEMDQSDVVRHPLIGWIDERLHDA